MKVVTQTQEQTQDLAAKLAQKHLGQPVLIALQGDLGSGKTTFAQGFAKGLGISSKILSPTFVITRQYQIPRSSQIFYHVDLYRLDENFDTINTGIQELLDNQKDIVLLEWPERLGSNLPQKTILVTFKYKSENEREIEING